MNSVSKEKLYQARARLREAQIELPPKIALAAIRPHLARAAQNLRPRAVEIVMRKFKASGLQKHYGDLEATLKKTMLVISWTRDRPNLYLQLPAGLGEGIYARVWSLDRGRKSQKGKTKPWNIFTLSNAEKRQLGREVADLALTYFGATQE
jgi:hypothetical protein